MDESYEADFISEEAQMRDERRRKFFQKPEQKVIACGKGAVTRYDISKVPAVAKLSLKQKSGLDVLKSQIPQPKGAVPRTALPSWYELDMAEKIPMVPAPKDYIFYSRGKIGQPLHRCHPTYFSLWDHRNLERVVNEPYNALHDPHVKSYMQKPCIKSFLQKQGLVNEQNDVLCSLHEFNKFRQYLKTQYCDEVNRTVEKRDQTWKNDRDQMATIQNYLSNTASTGKQKILKQRRQNAKEMQLQQRFMRKHQFEAKHRQMEIQQQQYKEAKVRAIMERNLVDFERRQQCQERIERVRHARLETQKNILRQATIRDIEADERRKNDQLLISRAMESFKISWIDAKFEYCKKRTERDQKLDVSIREEIKSNARKRQRRVEHYRAMLPALVEKQKAEERRIWDIVRKFAMRWLEKVRRRLSAPKDVLHESVWIGNSKGVMDDTLKYLKEASGYEKMDDFVMNIIKLKRQIQHQIELEEAEEAAQAAAEAAARAARGETDPVSDDDAVDVVFPRPEE